jgi:4-hydroxy-tetrahydrodipicolinate synthase
VVAACGPDFTVLSGDDSLTLPAMAVGGHGCISTSSNVAPREMRKLYELALAENMKEAQAQHFKLLPLFDVLFCETNPIAVKAALHLLGLIDDEIRLPLTPLTEPNRERLQVTLKDIGLL